MDPDLPVLAALGVLLTQVRVARRALEDVQRSTARYGGFEFAQAFAEGPRFGQPPMFAGALMVHVVNINDLAPGNSFGGFLEAIFGGIGNFFGNLIGGVVSGTVSGLQLPDMIKRLERIVVNVGKIVDRVGLGRNKDKDEKDGKSNPQAQAQSGESLLTTLDGIRGTVRDVTALFQAAGGEGGGAKAAKTSQTPMSETGERWMAILNGVNTFLERTRALVDGIVLLIPMAVGGISYLIANLGGIRRALLEMIQFILRNALILRGVLLTVIFETAASAARLVGSIVGIIGEAVQSVLRAIFAIIKSLLAAAFDALGVLANALQTIIKSLLQWLVDGVFNTLRAIGELSVFRTIDHLIRILPSLLVAIMLLKSATLPPTSVIDMLGEAQKQAFKPAPAAGGSGTAGGAVTSGGASTTSQIIGDFPDIKSILQPLGTKLGTVVSATGVTVEEEVKNSVGAMTSALSGVAGKFDTAVRNEADFSRKIIDKHADTIKGHAKTLADAISMPIDAKSPKTGFEAIATAYETWLTGGGMNTVLGEIDKHFKDQAKGGEPSGALKLLRGQFDRPRASVEIDSVEIILDPLSIDKNDPLPDSPPWGPGDMRRWTDEDVWLAVHRHGREMEDRGMRSTDMDAIG